MRNILYIANSRIPTEKAHGKQIMETCQALAERDVSLTLLLPKRFNRIKQDPFVYYDLKPNFSVRKIFSLDLLFFPFGKKLFFLLQSFSFFISSVVYSFLRRSKIDLIYTRDLLVAVFFKIRPVFFEIHNIPAQIGYWQRMAWKNAELLVVISDGLKNKLVAEGVPEGKILVARDAVDVDKFSLNINREEARKKLHIPLDGKMILYAGHLYAWKGADTLAQAAGLLDKSIKVYLVGGAEKEVENYRKRFKFDNLETLGHHPPEEIPWWLKAADLLVLPNSAKEDISAKYTSPLKLFEYMASGTPILASALPSLQEVLTEKEALFFKPDVATDLAEKIKMALENPKILSELSRQARLKVQNFSWSRRAEIIMDKCQEIWKKE